jgi:hypothetical protein
MTLNFDLNLEDLDLDEVIGLGGDDVIELDGDDVTAL